MLSKKDHKKDQAFIRKNHGILDTKQMAAAIGSSQGYICQQRKALGLKSIPVRHKRPAEVGAAARDSMIKEAMNGEFSLGWLRRSWTAEGVGA